MKENIVLPIKSKGIAKGIKSYVMISLGLLIFTFGWKAFLIPHAITGGGIAGLSTILSTAFDINSGFFFLPINLFLLMLGFWVLGANFGVKTIFGAISIAVLFSAIPTFDGHTSNYTINFLGFKNEFSIHYAQINVERFAACLMGGAISGVGLSMIFNVGGSTGGTDIIAMIVNKYFRGLSLGRGVLYCDLIIIGSSYFLPGRDLEGVVYGYCSMLVLSITLDGVLNGIRQSVQFFIFSSKYEEISQRINQEVRRGCTIIDATGGHSKAPIKIVMTVVTKNQSGQVFHIINNVDPKAFVSQGSVSGVYGEGFRTIT